MNRSLRLVLMGALAGIGVAAAGVWAAPAEAPPAQAQAGKMLIRAGFREGLSLKYRLRVSGSAAWTPPVRESDWGKMDTDFTFTLVAKALRQSGSCTFGVNGERLVSAVENDKDRLSIDATPEGSRIRNRGEWSRRTERSPLDRETTVTFGQRWEHQFGTGQLHLLPYLTPTVDVRFWHVLTVAPEAAVAVGDQWAERFRLPVPGGQGAPLEVEARWRVAGWEVYRGTRVLALTLEAKLDLADSDYLMRNGDRVHVVRGQYEAKGKALWSVEQGVLCYATAQQRLAAAVDRPETRTHLSEHEATLELLGVQ